MKFLAFDTCQSYLNIIAQNNEKVHKINDFDCNLRHSEVLMPNIECALDAVGLNICDLDFIAVTVGAGSFTGIRIGISTALGLSAVKNTEILSVTSFETIAYARNKGKYLAVIDAKHDNFYIAGYNDLKLFIPPKFVTKSELLKIKNYKLISGVEIDGLSTEIVNTCDGLHNVVLANHMNACSSTELKPLYLRLSQAEEGRL